MVAFTRKQLSLTRENVSKLRAWKDLYGVSEAELVRWAIQAYDPEKKPVSPIAQEQEQDVAAVLDHISKALRSALESIESANTQITKTVMDLNDPARRRAIEAEARREIAENPGFLDRVADLL